MNRPVQPMAYLWWLVSRASGVVAVILLSLSVLLGLAMAARVLSRPGLKRAAVKLHEQVALTAIFAIAAHGLSLLGDHWLKPGWSGVTLPFTLSYRPAFTGLGIIAGYLVVLVGPTFYLRRRIGARRWRRLHRLTTLAWLLSVIHTIGSGTDAHKLWLQLTVTVPGVAVVYLLALRTLKPERSRRPSPNVESAPATAARRPARRPAPVPCLVSRARPVEDR